MKKIIIYLICLLSLFGCSKNNDEVVYHNAYNNIAENDIFQIETCFVISGNISNPSYVDSISTDIALITILSIDGGDNFGEQTNEYCYPYTYGKFKVEKVYKGNIEEEKEYEYIRAGGIIDYDSYYNSLSEDEKDKNNILINGVKPAYIKMKFEGDIDIEPGKTYLAYLSNPESGIGLFAKKDAYMINSFEGGLREVLDYSKIKDKDLSEIKVLNNFTGEYENINDILKN